MQRQERDTFGVRDHYREDSWGRAEAAKLDMVYETSKINVLFCKYILTNFLIILGFKKEISNDRERSRSRSRSRDREMFWDRSEVEGPPSAGSDREKERERREREYERTQIQREREAEKVYQPAAPKSAEKDRSRRSPSVQSTTPTFKTHMAQKSAQRKVETTTFTRSVERYTSDTADHINELPSPVIPAPVLAPHSLKSPASACFTYNRIPWKLRVRKEVFRPNESMGTPAALDILFAQVSSDVFGLTSTLRITNQEKRQAINLLNGHSVTAENLRGQVRAIVKRHLVEMARGWPLYFARLFIVSGSPQMPEVTILAVSHNGVFLARREQDTVTVLKAFMFGDLHAASTLPRPAALQLTLRNGNRLTLHAPRAQAIQNMIQVFLLEYRQVSQTILYASFLLLHIYKRHQKEMMISLIVDPNFMQCILHIFSNILRSSVKSEF